MNYRQKTHFPITRTCAQRDVGDTERYSYTVPACGVEAKRPRLSVELADVDCVNCKKFLAEQGGL